MSNGIARINKSRTYKANAGSCDKCGFFKTWDFRVVNPKSGKGMPGHITKDGYKIGTGDCPFYAKLEVVEDDEPKATIPQKPVDSSDTPADTARQVMGVQEPTDLTPIKNELNNIARVLESINTNTKQLVAAFNVAKSPEIDGSLGETIATEITEKFDFKFNKLGADIDALKEKVKKLGKSK